MKELLHTDNPAELALLKSVFAAEGIALFVFDENTSSMLGGLGGWTPCRLMVADSEYDAACAVLKSINLKPLEDG